MKNLSSCLLRFSTSHRHAPKYFLLILLASGSIVAPWRFPGDRGRPALAASFDGSSALNAELERIRDAALTSDYAYSRLAHLCNNIGPRLSGSPQAAKAVEYVAAEMR